MTLGVIAIYRLGVVVPIPGVNADAITLLFKQQSNTILGFLDVFSGGAMSRMSIFAMGIMPYINASIIMSLLQGAHVIPYLDHLSKEGEAMKMTTSIDASYTPRDQLKQPDINGMLRRYKRKLRQMESAGMSEYPQAHVLRGKISALIEIGAKARP